MRALAAIGLVTYTGEGYQNTPTSNQLLNPQSHHYIGEAILFKRKMLSLDRVKTLVQHGPTPSLEASKDGTALYDFYTLAKVSRPEMYLGRVQKMLKVVGRVFSKDDTFKVLDLGGGSGTLALEIAKAYPHAGVVIFEHPSVAALPRELIVEEGLEKQASVMEGDFNTETIGTGYDFIIASGIMDFAHHHLAAVGQKLYESLRPKGYLYVITHGVSEDYLSPKESIVGWLSGRMNGSDILTTEKTILDTLEEQGFTYSDAFIEAGKGQLKEYLLIK